MSGNYKEFIMFSIACEWKIQIKVPDQRHECKSFQNVPLQDKTSVWCQSSVLWRCFSPTLGRQCSGALALTGYTAGENQAAE